MPRCTARQKMRPRGMPGFSEEHELDAEIYKKKRAAAAGKGQRIDRPEPAEPT